MRSCPQTGLGVPECSCQRCLEEQLRQFQPSVLRGVPPVRPRLIGRLRRTRGNGRLAA